jgi:hypothetical protein
VEKPVEISCNPAIYLQIPPVLHKVDFGLPYPQKPVSQPLTAPSPLHRVRRYKAIFIERCFGIPSRPRIRNLSPFNPE